MSWPSDIEAIVETLNSGDSYANWRANLKALTILIANLYTNLSALPSTLTGDTITLPASGWADYVQTVEVSQVSASNTVIVSASPASQNDYVDADVVCVAQGEGTLTFECATTPTVDLVINLLIMEV